jgi:transcriptional regulator with XRE-family HTH domain
MWIDRAKEEKKRLNMSCRDISIATKGKLSERDVTKLLNGEYKRPPFDDVIALAGALHLSPLDLLTDTDLVIENAKTAAEASDMKAKQSELEAEIEKLKSDLEHKIELIAAKDELLRVYRILTKDM